MKELSFVFDMWTAKSLLDDESCNLSIMIRATTVEYREKPHQRHPNAIVLKYLKYFQDQLLTRSDSSMQARMGCSLPS